MTLEQQAKEIWLRAKAGQRPTVDERSIMLDAYYECQLPTDPDYSVAQWIEDWMPALP